MKPAAPVTRMFGLDLLIRNAVLIVLLAPWRGALAGEHHAGALIPWLSELWSRKPYTANWRIVRQLRFNPASGGDECRSRSSPRRGRPGYLSLRLQTHNSFQAGRQSFARLP